MAIPVEHEFVVSDSDGESAWLPLNRWGSARMRIDAEISGDPTFSIVGTQDNILREVAPGDAEELPVSGWADITAAQTASQDIIYRAIKVKVTAGSGTATVRVQSEGDC